MSDQDKQRYSSSVVKAPNSLRAMQIVTGAITLLLAAIVLAFPGTAVFLIVAWLSVSLLFGGIGDILTGVNAKHMSKGWRATSIGIGAVAIGLSAAVFAFPGAAVLTAVLFLSVALLFLGAGDIARGVSEKRMPGWARGMNIAVGVITLGLSFTAVLYPAIGFSLVYVFIAAALIVNGLSRIISGVTGVIFRPVGGEFGNDGRRI